MLSPPGHSDAGRRSNSADSRQSVDPGTTPRQKQAANLPRFCLHVLKLLAGESQLQVRLLHNFTAFTALSLSPATELWQTHAPLLAFEFPFVFDAIMTLSALDLAHDDTRREATFPNKTDSDLRHTSQEYLNKALQGYQNALRQLYSQDVDAKLHLRLFEAVYIASAMLSLCTLSQLASWGYDPIEEDHGTEVLWVKLVMGTRQIVGQWKQALGRESWLTSKVYTPYSDLGSPNMAELFDPGNRTLLEPLLKWASHWTVLDAEEKEAYAHTLSYLGLIYNHIWTRSESAQASCHRLRALPACVPRRFGQGVVSQQPLALTVLAYVFATMKLLENEIPWFRGIAERQVFLMQEKLPPRWKKLIQWPIRIASGAISKDVELYVNCEDSMEIGLHERRNNIFDIS